MIVTHSWREYRPQNAENRNQDGIIIAGHHKYPI